MSPRVNRFHRLGKRGLDGRELEPLIPAEPYLYFRIEPEIVGPHLDWWICQHPGCDRTKVIPKARYSRRANTSDTRNALYHRISSVKYCRFHSKRKNRETPEQRRRRILAL